MADSGAAGWFQLALEGIIGLGGALVGLVGATFKFSNRIGKTDENVAALELRAERLVTALELRLEHRIMESRHQIMAVIQQTCIVPLEHVEQRCGALEQDMAVMKDRSARD